MRSTITQFNRQSVWALIGLGLITASIYFAFWLRRQTKVLRENLPQNPIPGWFFPVSLSLTILSLGWSIPEVLTDDAPRVVLTGKLLSIAHRLFLLVWIFKVRNRLNVLLETSMIDGTWLEGVWTFLFGIFYLQFKLNRLHHDTQAAAATGSQAST